MFKQIAAATITLTLSVGAYAVQSQQEAQQPQQVSGPVLMTDTELDAVAAGQLIEIRDVTVEVSRNNIALAVPVSAAVAAFGSNAASVQTRPGRINQQQ